MAGGVFKIFFFGFALVYQISTSNAQFIQYAPVTSLSNQFSSSLLSDLLSNPLSLPPNFPPIPLSVGVSSAFPVPSLPSYVPSSSSFVTSYIPSLPQPAISVPTLATEYNQVLQSPTTNVDSNVLNNIAIALQMLVVSNLLNAPKEKDDCPDTNEVATVSYVPAPPPTYLPPQPYQPPSYQPLSYQPKSYQAQYSVQPPYSIQQPTLQPQPVPQQQQIKYEYPPQPPPAYQVARCPQALKNANYLTSSYVDSGASITSFGVPPPKPRPGLALMSPYEAIGPNSPFSDPILSSPYGSIITSKNDFQSPYALF